MRFNVGLFILICAVCVYFCSEIMVKMDESSRMSIAKSYTTLNLSRKPQFDSSENVYFNNSPIQYKLLSDPLFQVSRKAGKLVRAVQFCQYVHKDSAFHSAFNVDEYETKWVDEIPDFSSDTPERYLNPRDVDIKSYETEADASIGDFIVNSKVFESSQCSEFIPTETERRVINQALPDASFVYLAEGWFYSAYENDVASLYRSLLDSSSPHFFLGIYGSGPITIIISIIVNVLTKLLTRPSAKSALNGVFSQCRAGDVRMKIAFFQPQTVSLIGTASGRMILNGTVKAGSVPLIGFFESSSNDEVFRTIKIVAIFGLLFYIYRTSSNWSVRVAHLTLAALIVLSVRSSIWNRRFLDWKLWGSALLLYLPLYIKVIKN